MKMTRGVNMPTTITNKNLSSRMFATNPPVYMCEQCKAVQVHKLHGHCPACVKVVANQHAYANDQREGLRMLRIVLITTLLIGGFAFIIGLIEATGN